MPLSIGDRVKCLANDSYHVEDEFTPHQSRLLHYRVTPGNIATVVDVLHDGDEDRMERIGLRFCPAIKVRLKKHSGFIADWFPQDPAADWHASDFWVHPQHYEAAKAA